MRDVHEIHTFLTKRQVTVGKIRTQNQTLLVILLQELDFLSTLPSHSYCPVSSLTVKYIMSKNGDDISHWRDCGALEARTAHVLVGIISGTVRINNKMQSICMLSYSTLWGISVPPPIHSALAAEWITASTDPSLSPPPLFIFLPLTFIEAFQRNSPLAIHFLKWSYGEKAHGLCVCVCMCDL